MSEEDSRLRLARRLNRKDVAILVFEVTSFVGPQAGKGVSHG
jgi:hypothetical protein